MNWTRRELVSSLALAIPGVALADVQQRSAKQDLRFFCWDAAFPIIYSDQTIEVIGAIEKIEFFEPLFGGYRDIVNPQMPAVTDGRINFPAPGEYYLKFNDGGSWLRTCVLKPGEALSESLIRIFDFTVANMFYTGLDDNRWYTAPSRQKFVWDWFTSPDPLMLSCGPTHAVFRLLVEDRLGLPTRVVTFPGTYIKKRKVVQITHNVAEVYVPEHNTFVVCDVNNGFLPRWMDAITLSEIVTAAWCDKTIAREQQDLPGLDLYYGVHIKQQSPKSVTALKKAAGKPVPFQRDFVSNRTIVKGSWLRCLYGGVAYWGGDVGWQRPTGTEFLPGDYHFVNLHHNPEFALAAVNWIEELSGLRVSVRRASEMRSDLSAGHKTEVATARWWGRKR
jgi:hypothetical protein